MLGTGLGDYAEQPCLAGSLVRTIADGWTLGGLSDLLRRQAGPTPPPDLITGLGPLGTALFTDNPETRLPAILGPRPADTEGRR
ncbi:MAG: hypothetical protein WKF75_05070 [Singulisphaera sp.]